MPDTKRPKLSLPAKAGNAPASGERRRPPLRGANKPRPPERARPQREERPAFGDRRRDDERPRREGFGNDARRSFGDRPQREGFGDRPPRSRDENSARGFRDSGDDRRFAPRAKPRTEDDRGPRRPAGAGRDENRRAFGERDERPSFRRDDGNERRPYGERAPREGRSFGDRPAFRDGDSRRPEGRNADERRPSFRRDEERPRFEGERQHQRRNFAGGGERPQRSFRDDERRPPFKRDGERGPRDEQRGFRGGERDGHPDERRPAFRREEGRGFEERRPYGDRPQREGERPRREFGERPAFRDDSRRPAGRSFADRPRRDDAPRSYGERPRRDIERDGPAPAPTFGDDMLPAAPRGTSFGRSRVEPHEAQSSDTAQPAPSKPRRPAPPESFASRPSADTPADQPGAVRLSKLMSELGLCSRREADEYIERGWVSVDGEVVSELGSKVLPTQHIELNAVAEEIQLRRITVLINKPIGYVSGQAEDGYEPAAVLITPENHWSEDPTRRRFDSRIIRKLAPAGRLDIDSTGLLVLTQDGRVAKQIIGETSDVEKEYLVRVEGELSEEGMRLLHHGLTLDGVELEPAKVSWQNEDQLRFVLHEGRKRQIRRMCELVGLKVVGLKRIRIGRIPLGKLPLGQWRYLGEHEQF